MKFTDAYEHLVAGRTLEYHPPGEPPRRITARRCHDGGLEVFDDHRDATLERVERLCGQEEPSYVRLAQRELPALPAGHKWVRDAQGVALKVVNDRGEAHYVGVGEHWRVTTLQALKELRVQVALHEALLKEYETR